MLIGRKGMRAAFRLGRTFSRKRLDQLCFRRNRNSPCHATLTELLRILDPDALAEVFSQFTTDREDCEGNEVIGCQLSIDGKTLRGSKDADGTAEHVLSAFSAALGQSAGHCSSRGKGLEIPDAMRLLEKIDLEGLIVTGDAIFCQKTITSRIVEKGGDYVLPVKRNQKDLHEAIATAFNEPVFPLAQWHEQPQLGHGRIDQRHRIAFYACSQFRPPYSLFLCMLLEGLLCWLRP